jgi:hypothetical protein
MPKLTGGGEVGFGFGDWPTFSQLLVSRASPWPDHDLHPWFPLFEARVRGRQLISRRRKRARKSMTDVVLILKHTRQM